MSLLKQVIFFRHETTGQEPVREWLDSLRDRQVKFRIMTYLERLKKGHLSNTKSLGAGLFELKMNFGPGFRIYYCLQGLEVILLLMAGDKSSQESDIKVAKEYFKKIKENENGKRN